MALAPHVVASRSTLVQSAPPPPRRARGAPGFVPLLIRTDHCKGCELCISACPQHCLELDASVVDLLGYHPVRLTDATACTSCAICARVCPDAVFTVLAPAKEVRP